MIDDKDIVRMTIVYKDGSMTILVRDGNVMRIERRQKWWIVQDAKGDLNQPKHIICVGMVFVVSVCR